MYEARHERMPDKNIVPTLADIEAFVGAESVERLSLFEKELKNNYILTKDLRFPFGNNYGWGYKYSHKSKHLCYAFFEKNALTITLQLGDKSVVTVENILLTLNEKSKELWKNRYPCGENGGWIHYQVLDETEIPDIIAFINAKVKPIPQK